MPQKTIPPIGILHYIIDETKDNFTHVHLRIDTNQNGFLFINASKVYHLNPTATLMAFLLLEKINPETSIKRIQEQYNVKKSQAIKDFELFSKNFFELLSPNGACPIHELDVEILPPFQSDLSAPFRMDLAITYNCNNNCVHCYNARPRDFPQVDTEQWKKIIDQIWKIGIPHIVFTGGEPTLRPDLVELIAHAHKLGLITGINTNGRRLSDNNYLFSLVHQGLDHVQITLESHIPDIHDQIVGIKGAFDQTIVAIQNSLHQNLFLMTNTTLLQQNYLYIRDTLEYLTKLRVPTIGLNALIRAGKGRYSNNGLDEKSLKPLLETAQNIINTNHQRLIWYSPTQYCNFDPMQLSLGIKGCTAALYNMCIEPDGGVLPCQSYYVQLGNILKDDWSSIWNNELALHLRQRKYLQEKCVNCLIQLDCGGGCPLSIEIENSNLNR